MEMAEEEKRGERGEGEKGEGENERLERERERQREGEWECGSQLGISNRLSATAVHLLDLFFFCFQHRFRFRLTSQFG